jgi:hypothetical protein
MQVRLKQGEARAMGSRFLSRWAGGLALLGVLHGVAPNAALTQERKVGVVTGLAGEAMVVHASLPRPKPLKFQDDVFFKDRIETQQESVVKILLGGKAILTVRELSTVSITEEPRRSIIDFQAGRVALQVIKKLFAMGESVEVHTPNAVAAVRGSLLVVEMGGTPSAPEAHFSVLEAHFPIIVTPKDDPSRAVPLSPNQAVSISGLGKATRVSPVRRITRAAAQQHARTVNLPAHARQSQGDHGRQGQNQQGHGQGQDHRGPGQNPGGQGQGRSDQGQRPSQGAGPWQGMGPSQGPAQSQGPGGGQDFRGQEQSPAGQWEDRGQGMMGQDRRGPSQQGDQGPSQPQQPPSSPQGPGGFKPGGPGGKKK